MKEIDGKWIVGLVFSNEQDAERFEQAVQGDDGEEVLAALREVETYDEPFVIANTNNAPVHGVLSQIGHISGKRVR